jgi:hypothetical protein
MKFFTTVQNVTIDRSIAEEAWSFANKVVRTTDYADNRQTNKKKVTLDHFTSKLGEAAVYIVLSEYGSINPPDYNVYPAKQKSWSSDLYFEDISIAVKTQLRSQANRYGLSWVFQGGPQRRDTILDQPEAWVFFVECNDTKPNRDIYELYVYPPYQMKELNFGDPKRTDLIGQKLVVYADELTPHSSTAALDPL